MLGTRCLYRVRTILPVVRVHRYRHHDHPRLLQVIQVVAALGVVVVGGGVHDAGHIGVVVVMAFVGVVVALHVGVQTLLAQVYVLTGCPHAIGVGPMLSYLLVAVQCRRSGRLHSPQLGASGVWP